MDCDVQKHCLLCYEIFSLSGQTITVPIAAADGTITQVAFLVHVGLKPLGKYEVRSPSLFGPPSPTFGLICVGAIGQPR